MASVPATVGRLRVALGTELLRRRFNLFPAYWGSGGRLSYLSYDLREVRLELPLNWRTRNYVGTIFGGSMFAALDPIPSVMLIRNLGPGYVVWDKSATIDFKKAGRNTLYARFVLSDEELDATRAALEGAERRGGRSVDRPYTIELADTNGVVHATMEKTVYVRRKDAATTIRTQEEA
jgi:acyl-coenzyme A thioesterase PaaI-like protein